MDESGESMEPMGEVPLIGLGESEFTNQLTNRQLTFKSALSPHKLCCWVLFFFIVVHPVVMKWKWVCDMKCNT